MTKNLPPIQPGIQASRGTTRLATPKRVDAEFLLPDHLLALTFGRERRRKKDMDDDKRLRHLIEYATLHYNFDKALAKGTPDKEALGALLHAARSRFPDLEKATDEVKLVIATIQQLEGKLRDAAEAERRRLEQTLAKCEIQLKEAEEREIDLDWVRDRHYALVHEQSAVPGIVPNLLLRIDYDGALSRHDLSRLLAVIDELVEDEVIAEATKEAADQVAAEQELRNLYAGMPERSFVGITTIEPGSTVVFIAAAGKVIWNAMSFTGRNFGKGVQESELAKSLQQTGVLLGTALSRVVTRFNEKLATTLEIKLQSTDPSKVALVVVDDSAKLSKAMRKPRLSKAHLDNVNP